MALVPIDQDLNLFAKHDAIVAQWQSPKLHPLAKKIAIALAQYCAWHGRPGVVTSIYRDDEGVHGDWRAIDMRCRSTEFDIARQTEAFKEDELIREKINTRFVYGLGGDGRKRDTIPPLDHKAAQHTQAVTGVHFHIQIPAGAPRGGGGAK